MAMDQNLLTDYNWLVDLGALLDYRLGAMFLADPNSVLAVLDNGWHTRTKDRIIEDVGGLQISDVQELIRTRCKDVAMASMPTLMNRYILDRVLDTHVEQVVASEFNKHHLTINTYPLALTEPERRTLIDIVFELVPIAESVEVVSLSQQFITPRYLKGKHKYYVTYDFFSWIKMFDLELNNYPIPEITIIAPRLVENDPEELRKVDSFPEFTNEINPWVVFSAAWGPFVQIQFEDVRWFSVTTPTIPT